MENTPSYIKPQTQVVQRKVHPDGFKPTNTLEWWSVVTFMNKGLCQLVGLIERKLWGHLQICSQIVMETYL